MRRSFALQDRHEPAIGFRVWRMHAVRAMEVAHTHPDVEINFLFEGSLTYLHGGAATKVEAGRFTIFWGGVPHQVLPPGIPGEGVWITLPLAWFLQWRLPNGLHDRVLAGEIVAASPSPGDRALLERWVADTESGDEDRRRVLQLEMEARVHRLALDLPRRRAPGPAGADGTGRMARITRFIAQHYRDQVSVGDVAAGVGVHPKYLMRMFKKQCGVGVWEYLTRLRVSHAQRLLITGDAKVLDVAMESGFASVAPFYAAFAARTGGLTPLAYRRRYRFAGGQTR